MLLAAAEASENGLLLLPKQVAGEIPVEAENRPVQERFDEYFKGK